MEPCDDADDGVFDEKLDDVALPVDIVISEGVPLADAPSESVDVVEIVDDNDRLLVDDRGSPLMGV